MSMSTQHGGGNRKPSTKPVAGAKPKQGGDEKVVDDVVDSDVDAAVDSDEATPAERSNQKASPRKSAPAKKTVAGAKRPATKTAGTRPGGGRPPGKKIAPVKVSQGRPWGPIALFTAVAVLALGIIGFAGWQVYENGLNWQDRAARIEGIQNFRKSNPAMVDQREHVWGPIKYEMNPPVAGNHNQNWQRCLGDVYPAAIASEHALHAMEHGAVWVTYNPSLPADQVAALAKKVKGQDYLFMSPYPDLDKPISLQAWGYQLKVDKATDPRVDEFIKALKQNASLEPGTPCSSGSIITETGTTPRDLGKDAPAQQPQTGG